MNEPGTYIYRVWYSGADEPYIAYIGRTRTSITQRMRGHVFKHPFQKSVDICGAYRVDYAEFKTVADMYVAEVVLINQIKPPLNVDDKARDELTFDIDFGWVQWSIWDKPELIAKWRREIERKEQLRKERADNV